MTTHQTQSCFAAMTALRIVYEDLRLAVDGPSRTAFNARPIHVGSSKDGKPMVLGDICTVTASATVPDLVLIFKVALQVGLVNLNISTDLKTMYFRILDNIRV